MSVASSQCARRTTAVTWGAAAVTVVALLVALRTLPLELAVPALEGLGAWAPMAFGATYALATVLMLPGFILALAGGAVFGPLVGTIAVSFGSTSGAALAFLVARHVARRRVERALGASPTLRAVDEAIGDGGWRVVALLRLSPAVPFNVQNYLYGLTRIGFWPCVLTSWLAMMPGTIMYVSIGHVAGAMATSRRGRSAAEWIALGVGLAATVAVTVYVTRLARRRMRERTAIEDAGPAPAGDEAGDGGAPSRRRPIVAVTVAVLAVASAAAAHLGRDGIRSTVTGWFGPPVVEMAEIYAEQEGGVAFDHGAFTALLAEHVDDGGWVDYAGLLEDEQALGAYLDALEAAPFGELGRDQKLALLLNAYNAFTLRLILDYWNGGALESIRKIPAEKRWEDRRWAVGGKTLSLNEIEHAQIRPRFREPRVHFALVCAAVGCPPLAREAFTADRLERQLEARARSVHGHATWFQLDRDAGVVRLTPLYDWYAGDFEQVAGSVLEYVARYSDDLAAMLREGGEPPRIEWLDYDWDLNGTARREPRSQEHVAP